MPDSENGDGMGGDAAVRLGVGIVGAGVLRLLPHPGPTDAILPVVAERWREILPPDGFVVRQEGALLSVTALDVGGQWRGTYSAGSLLTLRLPAPIAVRLRIYFGEMARELQEFVSKHRSEPWPAPRVSPHVRVADTEICVWYSASDEMNAVLRWRTIVRSEIGL